MEGWGMKVDPISLTDAARSLEDVASKIKDPAHVELLNAQDCIESFKNSPVATALENANEASSQAKDVIETRIQWMAHLLYTSAKSFQGSDVELANSLQAMGELNTNGL